jgi:hypothetical protein
MLNGDKIDFKASIILGNKRGEKESENEQTTGWSYMGFVVEMIQGGY